MLLTDKIYGAINIGTLKVKSLFAYFNESGQMVPLYRSNNLTCFGCGMWEHGNYIQEENLQATIQELLALSKIMENYQSVKASVFATHALRDAKNRDDVTRALKEKTGFDITTIDPEQEGKLYFEAVLADLPQNRDFVVVDMGGGSCQVLIGSQVNLKQSYSFKTGAQFLHEKFTQDPHSPDSRNTKEDLFKIKDFLLNKYSVLPQGLGMPLVYGSSNIIDLLKSIRVTLEKYPECIAHPYKTHPAYLNIFVKHILNFSFQERDNFYPFQTGYMWGIDKAFTNIITLAEIFHSPYIIPTNVSIIEGFLRKMRVV